MGELGRQEKKPKFHHVSVMKETEPHGKSGHHSLHLTVSDRSVHVSLCGRYRLPITSMGMPMCICELKHELGNPHLK